ncbi:MAG TPA: AraC family transcriptional regulator [Lachnospiraceae bacterium]|nr:AraC family transcriptional regulator [Lachnospiraceae bacterium]
MKQEERIVYYDPELEIEIYELKGIAQKFTNHFHKYYVIGFIECGQRAFCCNGNNYILNPGDAILINPNDTHSCEQIGKQDLHYFSLNIKKEVMRKIALEITGKDTLPYFKVNVLLQSELCVSLNDLKTMIIEEQKDFKKEEIFLFLMEQLINDYSEPFLPIQKENIREEIPKICAYLEKNYTRNISLDEISTYVGLSKYYLLRFFTKEKGITPHRYLENIRIEKVKQLLEQGIAPIEVAALTGFTDQSHLTNMFKEFMGVTPKVYMSIFSSNTSQKGGDRNE